MLNQDNLEVCQADGSTCFVCDRVIDYPQHMKMVTVKVKVLLTTLRKSVHIDCADEIRDLIELRVSQAKVKSS